MKHNKLILSFCLIVCLSGCQDSSMSDLKEFVDSAFKDERPDIEPLPVVAPFTKFAYSAADDNDPFSFDNIVSAGGGGAEVDVVLGIGPDENRVKEPLEEYPLDALRMVGTLSKKDEPWVIVKTTQGTVLLATIGNYMGENNGKIKRISTEEQFVVLTETVPDPSGRWITQDVEIIVDEQ